MVPFKALWDTGATNSVIAQAVVDACGLAPIGITTVSGVGGNYQTRSFLVNIGLPNYVLFPAVHVILGTLGAEADVLIGMDIIGAGDFALTSPKGKLQFTFRIPS